MHNVNTGWVGSGINAAFVPPAGSSARLRTESVANRTLVRARPASATLTTDPPPYPAGVDVVAAESSYRARRR